MPGRFRHAALLASVVVATGCNGDGATAPQETRALEDAVDPAIRQLLANAGYDAADISDVSRVVWRNASLGCPEPGNAYAQVLVSGYLIEATVDGTPTRLHASDQGRVIACPAERAQAPLEKVSN